jgi:DNA repair protein RadD
MSLRDYQRRDLTGIWGQFQQGCRRLCYTLPTGGGKTVVFTALVAWLAAKGYRIGIVVHRIELVTQTCDALAAAGLTFGVIARDCEENPEAPIQVAMAQTLARRLDRLKDVQLLVVDEAHHALAPTWLTILGAAPQAYLLGCTATPERLSGEGLKEVFDALLTGPTPRELIDAGWLSDFIVYVPKRLVELKGVRIVAGDYALGALAKKMNRAFVHEDVLAEYNKHLAGRSAIAFCTNIKHSQTIARYFCDNGVRAVHLDGNTPRERRRAILAQLSSGEIQLVCNCSLIAEGLDIAAVCGVILLRPTKSLALYLQQVGRALRPLEGKSRAVILDHAGNVFRHGLLDVEHEWSLDGRPKKKGKALARRCPECGVVIPIPAHPCPECGADLRPTPSKPIAVPATLVALSPEEAHQQWLATGPFQAVTRWAGSDETRLRAIAAARNYKAGWVYHRLRTSRQQLSP